MCQDSLYTKDASFRAPLAEISLRVDSDQDYLGSLLRQDGLFDMVQLAIVLSRGKRHPQI